MTVSHSLIGMKQTEALSPSVVTRIKKLNVLLWTIYLILKSLLDAILSRYNTLWVGRVWAGLCGVGGHVIPAVLLGKSGNKAEGLWSAEPGGRPETLKQRRGGPPVWSESAWWSGITFSHVAAWAEEDAHLLSAWLLVGADSVERASRLGCAEVEG